MTISLKTFREERILFDHRTWINKVGKPIPIKQMASEFIYSAAKEVIQEKFNNKEEWLGVLFEELKLRNRTEIITKLMLLDGA